jgi:hypothetical protein
MMRSFTILLLLGCLTVNLQAFNDSRAQANVGLPLDPRIQAMVEAVEGDTIYSNLESLVGFYTRHTNSDTVSADTGIGAARRWIYGKFQQYAADPNTVDLVPSYFTFDATVCGIAGEHRNVLATLPGVLTPERHFISMGHMDDRTVDVCDPVSFAPGANDDGSGTVVTIEMARVMSAYAFESTVILMPVTGEDEGLFGSEAYADWALQQGMDIDGVLTNDVVGNIEGCVDPSCPPGEPVIVDSTSVRHFSGIPQNGASRQLARYMKLQASRYVPDFTVNLIAALDRPGRSGDHVPFYENGYPAVRFTEPNENGDGSGANGRQHNPNDTLSYYNTNRGYMANITRISVAGFASLALAPETPQGLEAFDGGDGETVLLTWPLSQTEPDFSGYMFAVRDPDSLYYTSFFDVGLSSEYTVGGLTPEEGVYFSLAAYDSSGNLSAFSEEILVTPSSLPRMIQNVEATSTPSDVVITWDAAIELDVIRYRVYRSSTRASGFTLFDSVNVPATTFVDAGLTPHAMQFYQIRSVDDDSNESPPSAVVAGQLVTHDLGILVVDGTRDGTGTVLSPTDAQVDDYYASLLSSFTVGGHFDVADSGALTIAISDADMAPFSTVLWHTDVRGSSPIHLDTSAIRKYLQHGGRLFIGGWKLSAALKAGATTGFNEYPAGTFVPEFLKVDSTFTSGALTQDFRTAVSSLSEYPDIDVDSAKIPIYNGTLVNTDVVLPPFADAAVEVVYTHHGEVPGSNLEGKPVGWRFAASSYMLVVFDFPLYYMESGPAGTALREALIYLGEPTSVEPEPLPGIPAQFALHQNYPNPFNPATRIRFDLPTREHVKVGVYNLLGQEVRILTDEMRNAGRYVVEWDGKATGGHPVSSGVYIYRMQAGSYTESRKMIMVK